METTTDQNAFTQPPIRKWIPEVGRKVKLSTWNQYVDLAINPWAWFQVISIEFDGRVKLQLLNGLEPVEKFITVSLESIESPIGWKPRYTATITPEKLSQFLSWFSRGITIRQSHYMPSCETAFQPADNDEVPNWKFSGDTKLETLTPDQCDELIQVIRIEYEWDVSVPDTCKYCVNGKRTPENNPALIGQDKVNCEKCGVVSGFSFDLPYHASQNEYEMRSTVVQCPKVCSPGECWVCDGTGIGRKYLSEIPKKERNKIISAMHVNGWKVSYRRCGGGSWVRERETVIKRFGQKASEVIL